MVMYNTIIMKFVLLEIGKMALFKIGMSKISFLYEVLTAIYLRKCSTICRQLIHYYRC